MASNLNLYLTVFLLSLLPSFEGRFALLIGIFQGLRPETAILVAMGGVILLSMVLPHAFHQIDNLMGWLSNRRVGEKIASAYLGYVGRLRVKAAPYLDRYGIPGLILFVALPIPSSGIWTGALLAYLLGMGKSKATLILLAGGTLSNLITLTLAVLGFKLPIH